MIHGKHLSLLSFGLLFGNDEWKIVNDIRS
jgi:hypothetical protein